MLKLFNAENDFLKISHSRDACYPPFYRAGESGAEASLIRVERVLYPTILKLSVLHPLRPIKLT